MDKRPLEPQVKAMLNLFASMVLFVSVCLILKASGLLLVNVGWFTGFGSATGLVLLEAVRLQTIHERKD